MTERAKLYLTGRNSEKHRVVASVLRSPWLAAALAIAAVSGCSASSTPASRSGEAASGQSRLTTTYGESGKLEKLVYDRDSDGKADTWGYMDGTRIVRVEIDENGDGRVDRWEFHKANGADAGDAPQGGASDPTLERVERATKLDGKISRWEYFSNGVLARIEEDTDGDGKLDKWESYKDGSLVTLSLDTQGRGTPDRRLVYAPDGSLVRLEADVNGTGTFTPLNP